MMTTPSQASTGTLQSLRTATGLFAILCALMLVAMPRAQAQTYELLHSFNVENGGVSPWAGVILLDGKLYGTTCEGGRYGAGTAYELSYRGTGWVQSVLYNFALAEGAMPCSGVVADSDGRLYGATFEGGNGFGTVYRLTPPPTICASLQCFWHETTLYQFQGGSDGSHPGNADALIFDRAGNIYGTTSGDRTPDGNVGTVFELSPSNGGWTETILYRFTNAEFPNAGVVFDAAGNLYGTTVQGGSGNGTVYELSPSNGGWTYQTIHEFQNNGDGEGPYGGVSFDAAGNLYGTTGIGGGTVFEMQPSNGGWSFQTIYSGFPSTLGPQDTPTLDSAGNVYGTVLNDHGSNAGLVFKLTNSGGTWTETNLAVFQIGDDSAFPYGSVILDASGNVYGTSMEGGQEDNGTVWEITQ